eukprot:TRINITY_DN49_c0_g3_i1.p1 TRINITY_DN49_c0_g3~~TRINITY_DN49_c0_g3_i1.p1  ORF type:complete len:112 (-),score=43.44 TRINITY_DN49_c0_g3_i1:62-397(-)
MRHLAAYLLAVLGGNQTPSKEDVVAILTAAGVDVDDEKLEKLLSEVSNSSLDELIELGQSKLQVIAPAGGASAASAGNTGAAQEAAPVKEKTPTPEPSSSGGGMMGFFTSS